VAERKAFLLRIDPGLWADLEAWAADELRSVNGQIEYLLKQAVTRRKVGPAATGTVSAESPVDPDSGTS
jgi:hypothetical protein